MKLSHLLIMLFLLTGGIACSYIFYKPEEQKIVNHDYDYLIEVMDGNTDSTLTYTLYDQNHMLIADGLNSKQLDSVIIMDNL
jgi:hypothetical protein